MPELRRDDADQSELRRRPMRGTGAQGAERLPPVGNGGRFEISGLAERFLAQKLVHERRYALGMKAVKGGQKHRLPPPGDLARQPALGQQAQNVLVAQAAQLPARVQAGQKSEDVLVEERIAR